MAEATLSPEILARMDEAICDEFKKSARLRQILPEVEMPDARYGVVVPKLDPSDGEDKKRVFRASTAHLVEPITLSCEIQLQARQLEDVDLAVDLARSATRSLCRVEDRIIAYGSLLAQSAGDDRNVVDGVRVSGLGATKGATKGTTRGTAGLFTRAVRLQSVDPPKITKLIGQIIAALDNERYSRPYAAALAPSGWEDYLGLGDEELRRRSAALGCDEVRPIGSLPESDNGTGAFDEAVPYFCIFPRDQGRIDLARIQYPTASLRGFSDEGRVRCFIEEQFLLRVKDENALMPVWTEPPTAGTPATPARYWYPGPT